jgi:HD-GYP domain-containing protein (c-di-GMP phosphodiesterase class II)
VPWLKKHIKTEFLRDFLDRALGLFPPGAALFLVQGEEAVAAAGAFPRHFRPTDPDNLSVPLFLAEGFHTSLALSLPGISRRIAEDRLNLRRILDFLAFSLHAAAEAESARRAIADETLAKYRELALLQRSVFALNDTLRLKDTTRALLEECQGGAVPAEMGCLFLETAGPGSFHCAGGFGPDGLDISGVQASRLFQEVVESGRGEIVNDVASDDRWAGEVAEVASLLILPVNSPVRRVGVLVLAARETGPFKAAHFKHLSTLVSVAGIAVSNALNFEGIQVLMEALLQALAEAIDARDPFTAGHSERVASLAAVFAQVVDADETHFPHISFTEEEISEIYYAGILHDIGKIGIKEEVLTKDTRLPEKLLDIIRLRLELFGVAGGDGFPWQNAYERLKAINASVSPSAEDLDFVKELSRRVWEVEGRPVPLLCEDEQRCLLLRYGNLTPEERREIERHPAESFRILQHIPFQNGLKNLRTIVRQHHERLDGSGYPDGVRGEAILFQSRLLAIVDIYDAITQERHYKPAAPHPAALAILREEAEAGRLDRDLVALFCECIDDVLEQAEALRFRRLRGLPELQEGLRQ